jgi:ParB family chromosome partitioning protein
LQREDLNAIDRALAFQRLYKEFGLKHIEIGKKVGKSREYISNTLRMLLLPQSMQDALRSGQISEGHTRPLLMLMDRPQEQETLFKEIMIKRLTVRDSEQVARRIAIDKARKGDLTPELLLLERELTEKLGTRVRIERKEQGGKVLIDFFSVDDLAHIRDILSRTLLSDRTSREEVQSPTTEPRRLRNEGDEMLRSADRSEDDLYSISGFTV